jgi:hypothetical protein
MQGYYSLIQYCPDFIRLEVCNLGLLLYCPDCNYLDAKITTRFSRIHTIFGRDHNLDYVQTFAKSFVNRIIAERDNIKNLDNLNRFIAGRANSFQITSPRSMNIIKDPAHELNELFQEIFNEQTNTPSKHTSIKQEFFSNT